MAKTNLLPAFGVGDWHVSDGVTVNSWSGYDADLTITAVSKGISLALEDGRLNGKTIEVGAASFSGDLCRLQVQQTVGGVRTQLGYVYAGSGNLVKTYSIDPQAEAVSILIQLSSKGAPPVNCIVRDLYINDVNETEPPVDPGPEPSGASLSIHKVTAAGLPASIPAGSERLYFVNDGRILVTTKDGSLRQMGGTDNGAVQYANAHTQKWINERKEEIKALQKSDCITFLHLTDMHVSGKDGTAGRFDNIRDALMVARQLQVDYICGTGDILTENEPFDVFNPLLKTAASILAESPVPWYMARGDHDHNLSGAVNPTPDDVCTMRDFYNSVQRNMPVRAGKEIVWDAENGLKNYFYVDDLNNRHRMIFVNSEELDLDDSGEPYTDPDTGALDCTLSSVIRTPHQINWFLNDALDMAGKTDWVVSFFSHKVPYRDEEFHNYGTENAALRQIVQAFNAGTAIENLSFGVRQADHTAANITLNKDFSAQGPVAVSGWFGGHIHDDCYKQVDGINYVVSTSTAPNQRTSWSGDANPAKLPPERNSTDLSMSMNLFVIDKGAEKVHLIKLGSKRDNSVKTSSDLIFDYT